jgi:chromatin remodeling complex protein RSC6
MDVCMGNTIVNVKSEYGILTMILNSRENVIGKMWHYIKKCNELSGNNLRVNCNPK